MLRRWGSKRLDVNYQHEVSKLTFRPFVVFRTRSAFVGRVNSSIRYSDEGLPSASESLDGGLGNLIDFVLER